MDDTDKEALERGMAIARKDPYRKTQMDKMLEGEANPDGGWWVKPRPVEEVMKFAAGCCQVESMYLAPYEYSPSQIRDENAEREDDGSFLVQSSSKAAKLVKRLRAAGLSRFEPDPVRALAEKE